MLQPQWDQADPSTMSTRPSLQFRETRALEYAGKGLSHLLGLHPLCAHFQVEQARGVLCYARIEASSICPEWRVGFVPQTLSRLKSVI